MKHLFLISRDDRWATSVTRRLQVEYGIDRSVVHALAWSSLRAAERSWVVETHALLTDQIESRAIASGDGPLGLRGALGVIDLEDDDGVRPLDLTVRNDWAAVAAMIVLTFPEVYWVFRAQWRAAHRDPAADAALFDEFHICANDRPDHQVRLLLAGFEPMFDPGGMRRRLLRSIGEIDRAAKKPSVSRASRIAVAASLDEEEAYAYFNAYTAYRFGYRSHVVTSYSLAHALFGPPGSPAASTAAARTTVELVFEDLFLNYPDRPYDVRGLSDLETRSELLPGLEQAKVRILATVGERDDEKAAAQDEYAARQRQKGVLFKELRKPLSGLYDIWNKAGLQKEFKNSNGREPQFYAQIPATLAEDPEHGHSTPGRLYAIATRLLFRCRRLARDAASVSDALQGALLALEAQELLAARTPTISLEAISLKHEMEVIAECMFYGLEHHLDVRARHDDLEREVTCVSRWFAPESHHTSKLNALINVVSQLLMRFRAFNRFDEEHAALAKLRGLHRKWYASRYPVAGLLAQPFLWYFNALLGSVPKFILALVGWTAALTLLFWAIPNPDWGTDAKMRVMLSITDAVATFFAAQPPTGLEHRTWWLPLVVGVGGVLLAFVHLGIFISYLYGVMARK